MTKAKAKRMFRTARRMFGRQVAADLSGEFCLVHLDSPPKDQRQERVTGFDPAVFFDSKCPMCKPFLDDGAYMVYTGDDLLGMRLLDDGLVEAVMLGMGGAKH
ncbi:MAG: hypothetical protein FJ109_03650 [Deltaproteobacteria bacterium]|nr:hypothetical protein [Deltaproteobacteria bacterium]